MDVALTYGALEIVGALDLDRTDTGISPRRLPAWTRPQVPDLFMEFMVTLGSGVRGVSPGEAAIGRTPAEGYELLRIGAVTVSSGGSDR